MDNISDFFFLSVNDNDSKLINKNVQFDVNAIRNETHHTPEKITQPRVGSFDEASIKDSNELYIRKIQSLEKENDRLQSIIESNTITINDSSKFNNKNIPDHAAKKISQLTANVDDLKSELQIIKSSTFDNFEGGDNAIKIKQLINELNLSNKKIFRYRNDIKQIKKNLQITQNALLNEVGDPAVMQAVLNETGSPNLIGRAQQILILKQKVKELEAKQNYSIDKVESSSRETIRKMEREREIEHKALNDAQLKICKLNKLVDKLKCQREASELGINGLRMQKQELLSKSEHDKELIDKLKTELNVNLLKLSKTKESMSKLEGLIKSHKSEYKNAQQIIEQQSFILKDKDETITNLKSQVLKYEDTISNRTTCKMNFSDHKDIFKKKLDDFENQQLKEILCLAHDHICELITNFKDKCLCDKQKSQKNNSKVELSNSFTSFSQKSNNIFYKLKTESNEKLNELQYKLERVEEECAALKDKLNILTTVHKKHVQAFKETLNKQNENAVQKLNEILT